MVPGAELNHRHADFQSVCRLTAEKLLQYGRGKFERWSLSNLSSLLAAPNMVQTDALKIGKPAISLR